MSNIRVSNIEAKSDASSPTIDEKLKITNSQGRVLMQVDGKTSGITTIGINTTGNTFTVDGNNVSFVGNISASGFSGNLVGNVTGSSITVGDKFISSSGVGLGATDTAGRNAGVGTATGTLVYNSDSRNVEVYNGNALGWLPIQSTKSGIKATGGAITQAGGKVIHTFTGSGSFIVNDLSLTSVDYLVVAAGGAGGHWVSGGGGAGGYRTGTGLPVSATPGYYLVTIGGGGSPTGAGGGGAKGGNGTQSIFSTITSEGGGGGGGINNQPGNPGGSGGGGAATAGTAGTGNTPPTSPPQGNNGANGSTPIGGGGGGSTSAGSGGTGGSGTASSISGTSVTYAGGGGGGPSGSGGAGGGGGGGGTGPGIPGIMNTGGGGGGTQGANIASGSGGSGIVIIAYTI